MTRGNGKWRGCVAIDLEPMLAVRGRCIFDAMLLAAAEVHGWTVHRELPSAAGRVDLPQAGIGEKKILQSETRRRGNCKTAAVDCG